MDFARNPHRLRGLRMYSWWTLYARSPCGLSVFYCGLHRLQADSVQTPHGLRRLVVDSGLNGLRADSTKTLHTPVPHRLHSDSTRTQHGLRGLVVDSTYSVDPAWTQRIPFGLNRLPRTPCGIHVDFVRTPVDVRRSPRTLQKQKTMLRGVFTLADSALILQKKSVESTPDSARVKTPHSGFFFFLKGLRNPVDIHKSQH